MLTTIIIVAVLVPTVIVLYAVLNRKNCPRCHAALPIIRKPGTTKQAMWGGWTCPNCGCEVDRSGRERFPSA